jgi:hypothetical protein
MKPYFDPADERVGRFLNNIVSRKDPTCFHAEAISVMDATMASVPGL